MTRGEARRERIAGNRTLVTTIAVTVVLIAAFAIVASSLMLHDEGGVAGAAVEELDVTDDGAEDGNSGAQGRANEGEGSG